MQTVFLQKTREQLVELELEPGAAGRMVAALEPGDAGFYCQLCNVRSGSAVNHRVHLQGKRHIRTLQGRRPKTLD